MRQKIAGGNAEERLQALEQLDAIRDPGAIKPLLRAFGQDGPEWRSRLGRTIAGIPGTLATAALVDLVLGESDLDVRQGTLDALSQRREPDTSSRFGAALRSKDPIIHGRAAWALAALDEQAIVPKLVPLLVHSQRRVVMVPSAGGGGNMSATFSSGGGIPAPGGLGGFGVYSAVPILTGPAMAPGAVAFGATSVPFATDYAGFSSGGVAGGPSNVPRWRLIWNNQPNQDVHDALVKLTGIDLGFDENAWGQWVRTQFRPRESSTRRVGTP
jgi:hypothetical protein